MCRDRRGGKQQQKGVRWGVVRGGVTGGFRGFDGREEVIEFRSSVVTFGLDRIALFAQAAGRAIVLVDDGNEGGERCWYENVDGWVVVVVVVVAGRFGGLSHLQSVSDIYIALFTILNSKARSSPHEMLYLRSHCTHIISLSLVFRQWLGGKDVHSWMTEILACNRLAIGFFFQDHQDNLSYVALSTG